MSTLQHLSAEQLQTLAAVLDAFRSHPCVLIGATALNCRLPLKRKTQDLDFAVDAAQTEIAQRLEAGAWNQDRAKQQRWTRARSVPIDVLPTTTDAIREGVVRFDGDATILSVVGFDLAFATATVVDAGGRGVAVPSVPALVVLKMVSWLDRPSERSKDLEDIAQAMDNLLPDDDPRRWEEPLVTTGVEHEHQSAFFLGYEIGAIAEAGHALLVRKFLSTTSGQPVAFAAA